MKSLRFKFTCDNEWTCTSFAHPQAPLGDFRQGALQVREVTDIPDEVGMDEVLRRWNRFCGNALKGTKSLEPILRLYESTTILFQVFRTTQVTERNKPIKTDKRG